jgi:GNAT superfamily N-acetyltransferase
MPAVTTTTGDEIVTRLEMGSPSELVPARTPPAPIALNEAAASAPLLRDLYVRIGAPHGWTGRTAWSNGDWERELSRPGVRAWVACVENEVAGFVELEATADGNVGIVVFGLIPEYVGKGYGGAFLTLATRLAWELSAPDGTPARRVVVETWSRDHPNALRNYERRGFRVVRRTRRTA